MDCCFYCRSNRTRAGSDHLSKQCSFQTVRSWSQSKLFINMLLACPQHVHIYNANEKKLCKVNKTKGLKNSPNAL